MNSNINGFYPLFFTAHESLSLPFSAIGEINAFYMGLFAGGCS